MQVFCHGLKGLEFVRSQKDAVFLKDPVDTLIFLLHQISRSILVTELI